VSGKIVAWWLQRGRCRGRVMGNGGEGDEKSDRFISRLYERGQIDRADTERDGNGRPEVRKSLFRRLYRIIYTAAVRANRMI